MEVFKKHLLQSRNREGETGYSIRKTRYPIWVTRYLNFNKMEVFKKQLLHSRNREGETGYSIRKTRYPIWGTRYLNCSTKWKNSYPINDVKCFKPLLQLPKWVFNRRRLSFLHFPLDESYEHMIFTHIYVSIYNWH